MSELLGALSHIKVIDLTRARSGPTCIRQLSELGAQVVKIEAVEVEEDGTGDRHGFDFQNLHPNKRSMTLNLKHPEGRQILLRMVKDADVVVENFRPDVKRRLRIDYETLAEINPRIVYGRIHARPRHPGRSARARAIGQRPVGSYVAAASQHPVDGVSGRTLPAGWR